MSDLKDNDMMNIAMNPQMRGSIGCGCIVCEEETDVQNSEGRAFGRQDISDGRVSAQGSQGL